jgi:hypothetical protein
MISESEVEWIFFHKVRQYLDEPNRKNELHLTDLCASCFRRIWFDKKDPLPEDSDNAIRLWKGKKLHEIQLLEMHELPLEFESVKTKVDEYSPKLKILIEKKTTDDFIPKDLTELKKYYEHYINQVGFEWLFLVKNGYDVRQAFIFFIKLEQKPKLVKAFDVTSLINLDEFEAKFYSWKEWLENLLKLDYPPEITDGFSSQDYPCSYCKYRPRCW